MGNVVYLHKDKEEYKGRDISVEYTYRENDTMEIIRIWYEGKEEEALEFRVFPNTIEIWMSGALHRIAAQGSEEFEKLKSDIEKSKALARKGESKGS